MMMMMISWSKTEEVSEDWRQFHSEELIGLCSAPNIITVIEHRIIETDRPRGQATWTGHVAAIETETWVHTGCLWKARGKETIWKT
jgi:hypothetical protein